MPRTATHIWINGGLRPASEGVVPFINAGLHYGYSVFEGIRCYASDHGPAVFRLEEHVEDRSTPRTLSGSATFLFPKMTSRRRSTRPSRPTAFRRATSVH